MTILTTIETDLADLEAFRLQVFVSIGVGVIAGIAVVVLGAFVIAFFRRTGASEDDAVLCARCSATLTDEERATGTRDPEPALPSGAIDDGHR